MNCTPIALASNILPFLTLGETTGVVRKYLPSADNSASNAVDIPSGFAFGNSSQSTVYVSNCYAIFHS